MFDRNKYFAPWFASVCCQRTTHSNIVLLCLFCTCSLVVAHSLHAREKPNIVIILADDMGYGDIQVINPTSSIPTPNLNRLSREGMTFTDAHSPSAVCTPTRYGLLTGRYCWRTRLKQGVLGGYSEPLLEPGRLTLADMLRESGYRTQAVGKWHLGMALPMMREGADTSRWDGDPGVDFKGTINDGPTHHGFDHYFGVAASLDMAPYVYIRDTHFTQVPTIQQVAVDFPHYIRSGPRAADFVVDEVLDRLTSEAVQFIEQAGPAEEPYFLYLPLTGPHKPTQPHTRFRGKTGLSEYGDFVHQVDWTVGQVLEAIDSSGETENTLVVFTSDNGSYMYRFDEVGAADHVDDSSIQGYRPEHHRANGPLRGTKADVWEAGHRVPCFLRWPAEISAEKTCGATVCLTDLYATLAEIVGYELGGAEAEDSVSWVALLQERSQARGVPVINHSINGTFAIRDGQWKLVCGTGSGGRQQPIGKPFGQPFQLYDLVSDISEAHDVAANNKDLVERLTGVLTAIRENGRSVDR